MPTIRRGVPRKLVGIGPEARIGQDPQHEREAFGHRHLSSAARRPDSASRNPPFRQYQGKRARNPRATGKGRYGPECTADRYRCFGYCTAHLRAGRPRRPERRRHRRARPRSWQERRRKGTPLPPDGISSPDLHGFALLEVHDHPAFLFPPVFPERQARGHLVGTQFLNDVQREPAFFVRRRVPRAHAVQQEQGGGVGAGCGDVQGVRPWASVSCTMRSRGGRRAQRFTQDGRVRIALQQDMQERRLFVAERPFVRMQQSLFHGGGVLGTAQGEELRHVRIAGPPAFAGKTTCGALKRLLRAVIKG